MYHIEPIPSDESPPIRRARIRTSAPLHTAIVPTTPASPLPPPVLDLAALRVRIADLIDAHALGAGADCAFPNPLPDSPCSAPPNSLLTPAADHTAPDLAARAIEWAAPVPLRTRTIHEFLACGPSLSTAPNPAPNTAPWLPPLCILVGLAIHAWTRLRAATGIPPLIAWIGTRVHPYAPVLARATREGHSPLRSSICIEPGDAAERAWTIDAALRCQVPVCVIADGSELDMAQARRIHVAARAGRGVAFLARPPWEHAARTCAATRWRIAPASVAHTDHSAAIAWTATLLRCKDRPALATEGRAWTVEWTDDQGLVAVPALVERGTRLASPRGHAS